MLRYKVEVWGCPQGTHSGSHVHMGMVLVLDRYAKVEVPRRPSPERGGASQIVRKGNDGSSKCEAPYPYKFGPGIPLINSHNIGCPIADTAFDVPTTPINLFSRQPISDSKEEERISNNISGGKRNRTGLHRSLNWGRRKIKGGKSNHSFHETPIRN